MGDPRKIRKKYSTPNHPWQKERIERERELNNKYSLKNKKEIWKMNSILKRYKEQAKKLSSLSDEQAEKEKGLLLAKLKKMGLLKEGDDMDSILVLKIEDLMEKRLQTKVHALGLARSVKQARQFITHGHIEINEKAITSPSHIVFEDDKIKFVSRSKLSDPEHAERKIVEPKKKEKTVKSE